MQKKTHFGTTLKRKNRLQNNLISPRENHKNLRPDLTILIDILHFGQFG